MCNLTSFKGYSTSKYMNQPCISPPVVSLRVTPHESLSRFKKTWEGEGHLMVMLILHCRKDIPPLLPSQVQLSHWGMEVKRTDVEVLSGVLENDFQEENRVDCCIYLLREGPGIITVV